MKTMISQLIKCWAIIKEQGLAKFISDRFYFNREIIVTSKDLDKELDISKISEIGSLKFLEVSKENINNYNFDYPMMSRKHLADRYIKMGYSGFYLLEGDMVLGDIWYCVPHKNAPCVEHRDLQDFQISLLTGEVYMFDMHILQDKRGGALVKILLANALLKLKGYSFTKVYGYYVTKNIPALWVHRIFGYNEIKKYNTNRFLFYKVNHQI